MCDNEVERKDENFFHVMRTLRIYSLNNFHLYQIAMVTVVIVLYIKSYYFSNKFLLVYEVFKAHVIVTEHLNKLFTISNNFLVYVLQSLLQKSSSVLGFVGKCLD